MEEAKVTHPHGLAGQTDSCYFRACDYPKKYLNKALNNLLIFWVWSIDSSETEF